MSERKRRNMEFDHAPGPMEPTWSERRAWGDGGPPYRETLFPLWLVSATIVTLAVVFDWDAIPVVIGFPVAMMASLGFFWMLASPRRPRPGPQVTSTGRQANRRSIRSGRATPPHRR